MMRPVQNLALDTIEMIGTFEQVYLNVAVIAKEAHEGVSVGLCGVRSGFLLFDP